MSGRLIATVHVTDERGRPHVFGPADEKLPDWALGKIGAHAFEDGEHPKPSALKKAQAAASPAVAEDASELAARVRELEAENAQLRADLDAARGDQGGEEYDPSANNVDDVNAYLETADEDEVARVIDAEREGQARKGILEGPHAGATA